MSHTILTLCCFKRIENRTSCDLHENIDNHWIHVPVQQFMIKKKKKKNFLESWTAIKHHHSFLGRCPNFPPNLTDIW